MSFQQSPYPPHWQDLDRVARWLSQHLAFDPLPDAPVFSNAVDENSLDRRSINHNHLNATRHIATSNHDHSIIKIDHDLATLDYSGYGAKNHSTEPRLYLPFPLAYQDGQNLRAARHQR